MLEILNRSTSTEERTIMQALQSEVGFCVHSKTVQSYSLVLLVAEEGKTIEDATSTMLFMFPVLNWDKHFELVKAYLQDKPTAGLNYATGSFPNFSFDNLLAGKYLLSDNPHEDSILINRVYSEGTHKVVNPAPAAVITAPTVEQ